MKSKFIATSVILFSVASFSSAQNEIGSCSKYNGYINHQNGTITDPRTNLTWQICLAGQEWNGSSCTGIPDRITIEDATVFSASNKTAKKNDWRIPEYEEFLSILDLKSDQVTPSKEILLQKYPPNIYFEPSTGCETISPYPEILPSVKIEPASNRAYWTSTRIAPTEKYYLINFAMQYNKYRGVQISTINPLNSYNNVAYIKLVRGGSPRGDFKSDFFINIINKHNYEVRENFNKSQEKIAALSKWRGKKFNIGDETFCGPVIEIRNPMLKIAINAQLQGFGNEAWIKINDSFPAEYGCKNENGRLTPIR